MIKQQNEPVCNGPRIKEQQLLTLQTRPQMYDNRRANTLLDGPAEQRQAMVWYRILGFNIPLDTVQVISETAKTSQSCIKSQDTIKNVIKSSGITWKKLS